MGSSAAAGLEEPPPAPVADRVGVNGGGRQGLAKDGQQVLEKAFKTFRQDYGRASLPPQRRVPVKAAGKSSRGCSSREPGKPGSGKGSRAVQSGVLPSGARLEGGRGEAGTAADTRAAGLVSPRAPRIPDADPAGCAAESHSPTEAPPRPGGFSARLSSARPGRLRQGPERGECAPVWPHG